LAEAQIKVGVGGLYMLSGNAKSARDYLDVAKTFWLHELSIEPRNRIALRNLAFITGLEGEREAALKYIDKAISLLPTSKDKYAGPDVEENRMKILARLGDRDGAIPEIARLLKTSYQGPITPAELRLDPVYDKLRGDPRFEALLK
jgi:tetratricopeptide (TPR) repeat protein